MSLDRETISAALNAAADFIEQGKDLEAIECLQVARNVATRSGLVTGKAIAAHCVIAQQALLPVSLAGLL